MLRILWGFLPWILYFLIIGTTQLRIDLAVIVAFLSLVVVNFKEIRKYFILTWGSLIYFGFLIISVVIFQNKWVIAHMWVLSNAALASIAWFSLLIKKPFTLQYAKETVDSAYWSNPVFIKINYILTYSWSVILSVCVLIYTLQLYFLSPPSLLYQASANALLILTIIFTVKFPSYYRDRLIEKLKRKTAKSPFLQENFKPVRDELDVKNLSVEGEIPTYLKGAYMRNGPNPAFDPISYTYPFDGDGMIHAVYIENGKASYRNRYVQTDALKLEKKAGKALYGGILHPINGEFKNGAFINIIQQQNQLLALHESDFAYTMDLQLNTTGKWQPGTDSPIMIGPHPRFDPINGEHWFINYDVDPPFIKLYCIDSTGRLKKSYDINSDYSVMIHDFLLTKQYAVIFACPVILDMSLAEKGENLLNWRPELGTRIAIVNRASGKLKWLLTDPFFVFHFANAYELDDKIVIDYVRHSKFNLSGNAKNQTYFSLTRTTINLENDKIQHKEFDGGDVIEFPRIHDNYNTQVNRFIYIPKKENSDAFNCLMKYDMKLNTSSKHQFGEQIEIGEAVFAPNSHPKSEDDGCLLLFAYNKTTNSSDLIILDASNISSPPLARIKMPRRVPNGLHGNWMQQRQESSGNYG